MTDSIWECAIDGYLKQGIKSGFASLGKRHRLSLRQLRLSEEGIHVYRDLVFCRASAKVDL